MLVTAPGSSVVIFRVFDTESGKKCVMGVPAIRALCASRKIFILGTKQSATLALTVAETAEHVFLYPYHAFSNAEYDIQRVARAIVDGKAPCLRASDLELHAFRAALRLESHPICNALSWIRGVDRNRINRVVGEIVDPRLFSANPHEPLTQRTFNRVLRFLGITRNIFSRILSQERFDLSDDHCLRAITALRMWYKDCRREELAHRELARPVYPKDGSKASLEDPRDFVWRHWYNMHGDDPEYQATRRLCNLLLRLWAAWLGVFDFVPQRFFRYQCEAALCQQALSDCKGKIHG